MSKKFGNFLEDLNNILNSNDTSIVENEETLDNRIKQKIEDLKKEAQENLDSAKEIEIAWKKKDWDKLVKSGVISVEILDKINPKEAEKDELDVKGDELDDKDLDLQNKEE